MKLFCTLLLTMGLLSHLQAQTAHFLSWPCLSPDGQTIVFSFEGDLWKVPAAGGTASRLTAMQGYETNSRISPDGQWIAFSSRQYGNADVYVMPLAGGDIKQLTWHSAGDNVESWSWDSKFIYFNSNRYNSLAGYKVSIGGGTPQRVLGGNYYSFDHNLFEQPQTGDIYFNDTWESSNQLQRKRYKGPFNPDIQSWNPRTRQYKKHTAWEGKDFGANFDRNGNMYFISDEANGEYNLYTLLNNEKKALTQFNSSIKTALVNANGGKVVFEKDYQLWLYDVAKGAAEKINITVNRNAILPKDKDWQVKDNITAFDVSADGKKLAFISRGELFVSDAEGKFVQQIEKGSAERAQEVKWMPDNKTLLFSQTAGGYYNWFSIAATGAGGLKQLTTDKGNNRSLVMNKTRTKAVYLSGRSEVRLMDLKTMESKLVVKDELWTLNTSPGFSPNDEYIYYTGMRNFEQDIFAVRLKDNKQINLTATGVSETDPVWTNDGKYIYFITNRLKPAYPFGMQQPDIYRLPAEKFDEPYRMDKFNELFAADTKDSVKKDTTKKETPKPLVIDEENMMERIEPVGVNFGSQYLVTVLQKGDKTSVLYISNHAEGKSALWKTVYENFEAPKTEKIAGAESGSIDFAASGDKYFLLMNGNLHKLNLDGNKAEPIAISFSFRRNLQEEFNQMFEEAWAAMETNYYDEKFHGADWKAIKEKYRAYLPGLNNRADMRVLLNDMMGELNSSHQGFGTFGDDENIALTSVTMETGLQFDDAQPYKVKRVVKRTAADKKGMDILPGDELVKVNGVPVDVNKDRNFYFTLPSLDREMKLTLNRNGQPVEIKIHPQTGINGNLQDEWIDNCQQRVNQKSSNRIAYHCMKNMGTGELDKFIMDMTQDFYGKEALILDLRYNTGGNVHDEVLNFLTRKAYLQWKFRDGQITNQPNFNPADKPIVLLINEQSLSDAEMTAQGFKQLKLGTIIGMPTYRWIIFTTGTSLVDGSSVRLPSWGCYTPDGKDLEMTGVEPDMTIPMTFADRINGTDPQLDKAVEEILKKLKK
jgi:tricorn protease